MMHGTMNVKFSTESLYKLLTAQAWPMRTNVIRTVDCNSQFMLQHRVSLKEKCRS